MSKRFGRNQRRKMREEIAQLTTDNAAVSRVAAQQGRDAAVLRDRLETWARDVRHLLGDDSAFNEAIRRMEVDDLRAYDGRLRLSPIPMFTAPVREQGVAPFYGSVSTVIEALLYCANVSAEHRDRMSGQVRIMLTSRHGDVAYGMNVERHRAWSPRDIDAAAHMIAVEMTKFLEAEGALDKRAARA